MKPELQFFPPAAALLLLLAIFPSLAEDEQQEQAREILAHAAEISDIRSPGVPPFRMRARIRILLSDDKPLEGTYLLLWNSPTQWREEILFPGYRRIRVGGEGKYWQQRTLDHEPLRSFQFTRTLDFPLLLRLGPHDTLGKTTDKKHHGTPVKCVEVVRRETYFRRICLDAGTGRLVRQESHAGETEGEYSEYIPWGDKVFPGVLRTMEENKQVVEMRIEEISANPNSDPATYAPPSEAQAWAWCNNPELGPLVDKVPPRYPEQAKRGHVSGKVSIYAVIGTDGRLTNLRVVRSAGPVLDNASLEAVQRWRYKPTRCNGVAIREEVLIDVVYTLQR